MVCGALQVHAHDRVIIFFISSFNLHVYFQKVRVIFQCLFAFQAPVQTHA